jgi:hypothetical protein
MGMRAEASGRRWGLAAVLAVLVALGVGWGTPRSTAGPVRGAGPASVDLALPAGVAPLAVTPRADPRPLAPLVAPPAAPTASVPAAAPAAPAVRSAGHSAAAVPTSGGRSPPLSLS